MNQYKDCDIVSDLLPIYIDGKAGEESRAFVQEHLKNCSSCQRIYTSMAAEFPKIAESGKGHGKKRRVSRAGKIVIAAVTVYVLMVIIILVFVIRAILEGII